MDNLSNTMCSIDWNLWGTWIGAIGSVLSGLTAIIITGLAIKTYKKALIAYKEQAKINEEIKAITVHKIDIISRIANAMSNISEGLIELKSICYYKRDQIQPQNSDSTSIYEFINIVIRESSIIHKKLVDHAVKMKSLQIEVNIFYSSLSISDEKLDVIENKIFNITNTIVAISKQISVLCDSGELVKRNNNKGEIISFADSCCSIYDKLDSDYVDFILEVKREFYGFLQN